MPEVVGCVRPYPAVTLRNDNASASHPVFAGVTSSLQVRHDSPCRRPRTRGQKTTSLQNAAIKHRRDFTDELIYAAIPLLSMIAFVCTRNESPSSKAECTLLLRQTNPKYARQQVLENQSVKIRGICARATHQTINISSPRVVVSKIRTQPKKTRLSLAAELDQAQEPQQHQYRDAAHKGAPKSVPGPLVGES